MSYLSEFHSAHVRPVHLSLLSSFIMASALLQPLLAMMVLRQNEVLTQLYSLLVIKSWRLFILAGSLVSGLGALAMCWLPESPRFLLSMNKPEEALDILTNIFSINSGGTKQVSLTNEVLN